jgi:hypothetical protein
MPPSTPLPGVDGIATTALFTAKPGYEREDESQVNVG